MKQSEWNEGLNNLDSDIIENYVAQKEAYIKKIKKPTMWTRYISVAATFCLVFGVLAVSLILNRSDDEPITIPETEAETTKADTENAPNTEDEPTQTEAPSETVGGVVTEVTSENVSESESVETTAGEKETDEETSEQTTTEETTKTEETTEEDTKPSKYTALEFGIYDSEVGANHNIDIKLGTTTYVDAPNKKMMQITVNGITYKADYEQSQKGYLYNEDFNLYRSVDDTYIIEMSVNKNTGIVDMCMLVNKKYLSSKDPTQKLNQDECTEIAYKILGQYVNSEEYTLTCVEKDYRTTGGRYDIYQYWFYRIIDGVVCNDSAYIVITEYGDLYGYQFTCLGEMKDAVVPSEEELSDMRVAVDNKIKSIYANVEKSYGVEYEIRDEYFVRLADGKYAMEYVVDVNLIPNDPEGFKLIEKISLLVYV